MEATVAPEKPVICHFTIQLSPCLGESPHVGFRESTLQMVTGAMSSLAKRERSQAPLLLFLVTVCKEQPGLLKKKLYFQIVGSSLLINRKQVLKFTGP